MKYTKENFEEYIESRNSYDKNNIKLINRVNHVVKIISEIYGLGNRFSIWFPDAPEGHIGHSIITQKSTYVHYETLSLDFYSSLYTYDVCDYNDAFPVDYLYKTDAELKKHLIKEKTECLIKTDEDVKPHPMSDIARMAETLRENGYEVKYKPKK